MRYLFEDGKPFLPSEKHGMTEDFSWVLSIMNIKTIWKLNNGNILFIFIKSCYKSYKKTELSVIQ